MAWLIFYVSTYISSFGCVLWIGLIDPNFFLTSDPRMSDWREVLCICAEYVCMYVCMYICMYVWTICSAQTPLYP